MTNTTQAADVGQAAGLICPACGYDLRGLGGESVKCPECGTVIDRGAAAAANIPWVHRGRIGTWRAYARTVVMVMLRPARVAAEIARPVSFDDARLFNRRTVLLAWLSVVPLVLWAWAATLQLPVIYRPKDPAVTGWAWRSGIPMLRYATRSAAPSFLHLPAGDVLSLGFACEATVMLVLLLALLLWIGGVTRVGSYFFHPRAAPLAQQNRAVAISYYACAPLAWTPVLFPAFVYATWWYLLAPMPWSPYTWTPLGVEAARWISLGGVGLLVAWMVWIHLVLLRRTTQCGVGRMLALTATMPLAWVVIGAVALSLPAAAFVVVIMVLSLR